MEENEKAVTALTSIALLFLTGALAFYTARLWDATRALAERAENDARRQAVDTRESLRIADESARAARSAADIAMESAESYRASERAWVSYTSFDADGFDGIDALNKKVSGTAYSIKWINAGRTPAIRCQMYTAHRILDSQTEDVPFFDIPAVTGPDASQRETPMVPGVPISSPRQFIMQADMERLVARKCRIFLYGRAEYGLVFQNDSAGAANSQTEVCVQIEYLGTDTRTHKSVFIYSPVGPQNSAR